MSAIDNTPSNRNFLSPLNFKFQLKRSPHVNFFIQKVNIPPMELPPIASPNPFVNIPYSGEHISYGNLSITFKVDEDLQNYLEIHNWVKALGKPKDFEEYRNISSKQEYTGEGLKSDISLMVLSSTKSANYDITFADAFPISLSGIVFNTTDENVIYTEASAEFKYTYYDIIKV
jgi:hypothetical protein